MNGRRLHIFVVEDLARDELRGLLGAAFFIPDFICDDFASYLHVLVHVALRVSLGAIVQRGVRAVHCKLALYLSVGEELSPRVDSLDALVLRRGVKLIVQPCQFLLVFLLLNLASLLERHGLE